MAGRSVDRHTRPVTARTVGVEEEFLLVDPVSGYVRSPAPAVLRHGARSDPANPQQGGREAELMREQVETDTSPCMNGDLDFVRDQLARLQDRGTGAAFGAGRSSVTDRLPPSSPTPSQPRSRRRSI
jgi:glutamate---cysteine ligase / carboxylate-amine ligase